MKPRNRHGTPVDPVPFAVVALLAAMLTFSFGPLYGRALGYSLRLSLLVCGGAAVAIAAGAYHRLVWLARPELRGEIPAANRMLWFVYLTVGIALLVVVLSLPFV
ncbi:hypothetical protein ACNS7O_06630 [Haloferacaceae archaeon DSL9]